MLFVLVKLYFFAEVVKISVNAHADVAALFRIGKNLFVHTLLRADNGSNDQKALSLG